MPGDSQPSLPERRHKKSVHVSGAVASRAAYHPADGEGANTCLMLNRPEVCFSGGVRRAGRGGLCPGDWRDSSPPLTIHGPLQRSREVKGKRQGCSVGCRLQADAQKVPWGQGAHRMLAADPSPGADPKALKARTQTDVRAPMFTAASCTVGRRRTPPECPSTDEPTHKTWSPHGTGYH